MNLPDHLKDVNAISKDFVESVKIRHIHIFLQYSLMLLVVMVLMWKC